MDPLGLGALKASANAQLTKNREVKQDLGQEDFLKLLSTQMANQDPLEPTKDTDFVAQLAQFSSLETLQALNDTNTTNQAFALIGKSVLVSSKDANGMEVQIYGEVAGVVRKNKQDYLQIGSELVPVKNVISVYDDRQAENLVLQAAELSGKYVKAEIPSETEGGEPTVVEGKVDSIIIKNGLLFAKIGDKEVAVAYIKHISDEAPPTTEKPEEPEEPEEVPPANGGTGDSGADES